MTFAARALGALTIPVLGVPLAAGGAVAAPLPKPPVKSLPSALDVAPPYQGQRVCDPHAKPGVLAFAERGEDWAAFVDRLPRVFGEVCEEWGLVVDGEPTHGFGSLVVPVRRGEEAAVLRGASRA